MMKNKSLDLILLRKARQKGQIKDEGMGTAIDSYEAMLNELQLATQVLVDQSAIERQKAEILANQISAQIKVAEEQILKFMNSYQQQMFAKIYSQVKVSEESIKFKGTDFYDLSFISNFDYSQVTLFDDRSYLQKRPNMLEEYRAEMTLNYIETHFAEGLCRMTDDKDPMLPDLMNQRNFFMKQYYLSAIKFYQEATVVGFLSDPTNNIENLKEFIKYNESNISSVINKANNNRLSMGEEAFKKEIERIRYIERMVVTAKARLKYLTLAYEAKWQPPTFDDITKYAEENDLTYSKAVVELNLKSRETLCIPDWVLAIAEMYNQIEVFEQGSDVVPLNPYDIKWIRKAKEVINLEAEGVRFTAQKLFKAIDTYWEALTFGFQDIEDYHLENVLAKALAEDTTPISGYMIATNYDFVDFTEDFTPTQNIGMNGYDEEACESGMGGFSFKKLVRSIGKAVGSVAKVVQKVANKITAPVANLVRFTLKNTLGRVLPKSIYDKISNLTEAGLNIMQLNLNNKTFRQVVKGVTDVALFGPRIGAECWRQASKVGPIRSLDSMTGGIMTSFANLNRVPITIGTGGKVDWQRTAFDALKVGAVMIGASGATSALAYLQSYGTNLAVVKGSGKVAKVTGLDKTSLGRGLVTAGAMVATGQSDIYSEAIKGGSTIATNSVVNSTGLKDTKYGRAVAEVGVNSAVGTIQSNESFSQVMRDKAEDKLKEIARKEANEFVKEKTGVSLNTIEKAYDMASDASNSDKTLSDLVDMAKAGVEKAYEKALTQYQNLNSEEVMNKVSAEADRALRKQVDNAFKHSDKWGEELFNYLFAKYGPQKDYSQLVTPDDYLNYQIYAPNPNDRILDLVYVNKNKNKVAMAGLALIGGTVAYLTLND